MLPWVTFRRRIGRSWRVGHRGGEIIVVRDEEYPNTTPEAAIAEMRSRIADTEAILIEAGA